ncbi:putative an1-type zinc finger protein [Phaeoacremonium minimum UCRPA7]|uniref:Putative an1-type zinc finger protein n=1 Tax=Phaeoacremonium minimum (strain UCR-PA7) TaxID=1286976 RepID=R8BCK1_PHAM7|nr:putative an1-type zinc finger protein [Phaeoacremonium minimum UCRPA7]EON97028.1 putative an1-type zinc finger protein [Phaeoacremonium minimum UCRPA7]
MAPRRIKCSFKECKDAAQRIVGDCAFCEGHYCGKHRLLEDHKCEGLENVSVPGRQWWLVGLFGLLDSEEYMADFLDDKQCKKEAHEQNAAQLEAERTHVIRGV